MPELPDLQVFSRNLHKKLAGKKLQQIEVPVTKKLNVSLPALQEALVGQTLNEVKRDGKTLHFLFDNDHILMLHLMLNGELQFFEQPPKNNVIAYLVFEDGTGLSLSDYQQMAALTLDPEPAAAPDALAAEANLTFFRKLLSSKKAAIKNILLDQQVIRGIGNAYADEILWEARISPFSIANKIPEDKVKDLHQAVRHILTDAEKQILKSNPDLITGEVRDFLKVHGAKIKHSPEGAAVEVKKIGARKTYFTNEQTLYA